VATTISVPAGATASLDLGSGVAVRVNSVTQLSVERVTAKRIEVHLDGEAYFDVEPGRSRTLVIRTEAGIVRNTGTEFNVRARNGWTEVVVAEGAVEFEAAGRVMQVRAGEESRAGAGGPPTSPTAADLFVSRAWLDGILVFDRTPLSTVVERLHERFGLTFEVAPALRDERLTAVIRSPTASSAMEAICAAIAVRCTRSNERWRLTPR